jgi:TRAP-type C4-dicarboxylate transport system permease small subunit
MQDASIPRPRISNAIDNVARAVGGLAIATFTAIIVYVVICR